MLLAFLLMDRSKVYDPVLFHGHFEIQMFIHIIHEAMDGVFTYFVSIKYYIINISFIVCYFFIFPTVLYLCVFQIL
jgi:hypothetical protein